MGRGDWRGGGFWAELQSPWRKKRERISKQPLHLHCSSDLSEEFLLSNFFSPLLPSSFLVWSTVRKGSSAGFLKGESCERRDFRLGLSKEQAVQGWLGCQVWRQLLGGEQVSGSILPCKRVAAGAVGWVVRGWNGDGIRAVLHLLWGEFWAAKCFRRQVCVHVGACLPALFFHRGWLWSC